MSDVAIRVENLGKRYRIGESVRHDTLRDALAGVARSRDGRHAESQRDLWALRDVSFEVKRGEAVGVIGRNGAGKTTLLKILSRITEPTAGRATIHGRVGSLLEVGTGFHPELTGRENIYLNGAILGMRRAEIERRFDEIVAFAEIERFLDTPVKRYSSGMYVRLAFAVAAHLEPEILLVDEVLAVGDAAFQKRCLGKMGEVAGQGRTVLFVSHNMVTVANLTRQTLLLSNGHLELLADTPTVIDAYSRQNRGVATGVFDAECAMQTGDGRACVVDCRVISGPPQTGKPFALAISVERPARAPHLLAEVDVTFLTMQRAHILQARSAHVGEAFSFGPGVTEVRMEIAALPLVAGEYWVDLWLGVGDTPAHWLQECLSISVEPGAISGDRVVDPRTFPVVIGATWSGDGKVGL
ncbi:MAG: polysaccharide ABC transporter ATP-binding protein [Anaerolineae bacterium]|jgi:lipopolysaccharide transport system ATP-binding protein